MCIPWCTFVQPRLFWWLLRGFTEVVLSVCADAIPRITHCLPSRPLEPVEWNWTREYVFMESFRLKTGLYHKLDLWRHNPVGSLSLVLRFTNYSCVQQTTHLTLNFRCGLIALMGTEVLGNDVVRCTHAVHNSPLDKRKHSTSAKLTKIPANTCYAQNVVYRMQKCLFRHSPRTPCLSGTIARPQRT